jgi:hypothetical protein
MAIVIYGLNELSEDFGGLTHLALLTLEEAQDLEFGDFFREDEATPARFEDRLVVVEDFPALARALGLTAAEYLGRHLVSSFLRARPGEFFALTPWWDVAYLGDTPEGVLRALARENAWAVDLAPHPSDPPGSFLAWGHASSLEEARAKALEEGRKRLNLRVLRAL